jgi:hypothetical protein
MPVLLGQQLGQDGGVQVGVAVDEAAMHSGSARDR